MQQKTNQALPAQSTERRLEEWQADGTMQWLEEASHSLLSLMAYYRCAMMEVETKLKVLNEEYSIQYARNPINSIQTRLKSIPSIRDKMKRRGLSPMTLEGLERSIWDVAGIRVICAFTDDIYRIADCLLGQDDITLIEKKDYIASPKPNGYRSLHLIVEIPIFLQSGKRGMKVEIQLRTVAMDCWASLEHQLRYKKDAASDPVAEQELLHCAQLSAELDAKMNDLKHRVLATENRKE